MPTGLPHVITTVTDLDPARASQARLVLRPRPGPGLAVIASRDPDNVQWTVLQ
jgi:hypothetical protein